MTPEMARSFSGVSLTDLVKPLEEISMDTGERLALHMLDQGMMNTRRNTPVETHHLRDSYRRTEVRYGQTDMGSGVFSVRWSAYAWSGEVYTEVSYAPFVELGTGLWGPRHRKYKIEPKKPGGFLAFAPYQRMPNGGVILDVHGPTPKTGGTIFVRFVMHPGSPGHHMFRLGAVLTEREYEEWSAEPLRLWREKVERAHV